MTIHFGHAQDLVINEILASNIANLYDEDGDTPDWIELYNRDSFAIQLEGMGISDRKERRWIFPAYNLAPGEHALVYASDKNRSSEQITWQTVIDVGDLWYYLVPTTEPLSEWKDIDFNVSGWLEGKSGFGYGDGDDSTLLDNVQSVYLRKIFEIDDASNLGAVVLDIDYDDAFVAYINGVEVARANITSQGPPMFNQPADNYDHEAQMYQGNDPDRFELGDLAGIIRDGNNVIALQVHNHSTSSSDLTAIPFLTIGVIGNGNHQVSPYLHFDQSGGMHTDFKISAKDETIYLTDALGSILDSIRVTDQRADISYGRTPDGGEWALFDIPTPGSSNDEKAFYHLSPMVEFSRQGGFYSNGFQLIMSTDPVFPIYFTRDGSIPDTDDQLYTGPITVSSTEVIRARALDEAYLPNRVESQTYLIGEAHDDLPIISISADPENLWDENNGIFASGPNAEPDFPYFGANFWNDWEIPAHVELFEPDGTTGFSQGAGIKIFGGWSRGYPQKSMSLFFRNSYGGEVRHKVFPEMDLDVFHSLVLRNSGNDWDRSMLRDGFMNSLIHEEVEKQAFRPAVIYMNGEYWGMLNIREKINEEFLGTHYDIDPDLIHILENDTMVVEGSNEHYLEMLDFIGRNNISMNSNYDIVNSFIDVNNFIRYQVPNIYMDNTDWPGNNLKFWRSEHPGSRWRWISFDKDFGFNIWGSGPSHNTLEFTLDPNGPPWPNPSWSTFLFRRLLGNNTFKNSFLNYFADQLNTTYQPGNVISKLDQFQQMIEGEIGDHCQQWGNSINVWYHELDKMRDFAVQRPQHVWQHLIDYFNLVRHEIHVTNSEPEKGFVQINSVSITDGDWSGYYFQGVPVQINAIPRHGYEFAGWVNDFTTSGSNLTLNLDGSVDLIPNFVSKGSEKYGLTINEIKYVNTENDSEDWIEIMNRSNQNVDLSGWIIGDSNNENEFVIEDGIFITAGEHLVLSRELNKFRLVHPLVENVIGNFDFGLSSNEDCVRLFDPEGRIQDEVCYTNSGSWPTIDNGDRFTLSLKNPYLDNAEGSSWMQGPRDGSPGVTNVDSPLQVMKNDDRNASFYPNPATMEGGTISIFLDRRTSVSLQAYNMIGQKTEELYTGILDTGNHEFVWTNNTGMSGIVFIRIIHSGKSEILKIVVGGN